MHGLVSVVTTSSSLKVIMVKALNTQSVGPEMVMILSGQEPSEMLIRAPLWDGRRRGEEKMKVKEHVNNLLDGGGDLMTDRER